MCLTSPNDNDTSRFSTVSVFIMEKKELKEHFATYLPVCSSVYCLSLCSLFYSSICYLPIFSLFANLFIVNSSVVFLFIYLLSPNLQSFCSSVYCLPFWSLLSSQFKLLDIFTFVHVYSFTYIMAHTQKPTYSHTYIHNDAHIYSFTYIHTYIHNDIRAHS